MMKTIIVDKIASVTQACALSHELRVSSEIPCEEGIVPAGEILTNKSQYYHLATSSRCSTTAACCRRHRPWTRRYAAASGEYTSLS